MSHPKQYLVELRGDSREVYVVEADTEEEARAHWWAGWLSIQESSGMVVTSVRLDDE